MESVLRIAEDQARASGATRIHEVRVRVGQMTGIVPEALDHAFAVLKEGTLAADGRLAVDYVPGVCWCQPCQQEFGADGLLAVCTRCGVPSFEIRRGKELDVVSLEVD